MRFATPSLKPKPELLDKFGIQEGPFGPQDHFTNGLCKVKCDVDVPHPLASSELNYKKHMDKMNLNMLRNTQGLHAPLRIAMELKSVKRVGRLPFLPSSNVMYESLTGRDLEIGPEDIFNTSEFLEISGQPHAVVERSLGLL